MLRRVGRYDLLEEIGHGGMASVYRARDRRLDRLVAVKILHPHLQKTPEARARFTREAKSVARLNHPHIMDVYDFAGDESEESYLAAELLTGPTLRRFIDDGGAVPPEVAAAAAIQIAEALEAAHEASIIHRDVKPENVLFHERALKLTDFGVAQMVDSQAMTATGQILGSPGHMAPEQLETGHVDERSDIFALGTVLYFMATGRLPFEGRNPHQTLRRVADGDYTKPLRIKPTIGDELAAIIESALCVDAAERPQSATAIKETLVTFLSALELDRETLVADYLKDPDGIRRKLEDNAVSVLLKRAESAPDRSTAIRALNRVLAIDDGNEAAIALINRQGARKKMWVLGSLVTAVVTGGLLWFQLSRAPAEEEPSVGTNLVASLDVGVDVLADAGSVDVLADTLLDAPEDSAEEDVPEDSREVEAAEEVRTPETPTIVSQGVAVMAAITRGPRTVVFRPSPPRVAIAVDRNEPREFGPSFRQIELLPGPHHFRFIGAEGCCEDAEFTVNIPPGREPFVVARTLEFRPSLLVVRSDILPATVVVSRGTGTDEVRGRAGTPIRVPMGSARETRRIVIETEGHPPRSEMVLMRAGKASDVRVQFER